MAIDGIFLHLLAKELEPLCSARVDKVHQPAKETLILALRHRSGAVKLLLSASSSSPRVQLTGAVYENPSAPPMFCMLLRKKLAGAKLMAISQAGRDRILTFTFETHNELGDLVTLHLAAEIMGRHSNIVLYAEDGRIIDAIKRVDPSISSVRQVLPGLLYTLPPQQDKMDLLTADISALTMRICGHMAAGMTAAKASMASIMGISPIVADEIAAYAQRAASPEAFESRLRFFLEDLRGKIVVGGTPCLVLTREGLPKELSFLEPAQFREPCMTRTFDTYSLLLDAFYTERDLGERMKQRSGEVFRLLANLSERIERKLQHQQEELQQSRGRDLLRLQGDLLSANIYKLSKGERSVQVENFYEPDSPLLEIALDPRLGPAQNAQRYYAEYRKADTAERMLHQLMEQAQAEHDYIDTVMDTLLRATSEAELDSIREELALGGYLRRRVLRGKRPIKLDPVKYRSSDGFVILQGRGNLQNDKLTMKDSHKEDLWFHTQNVPGSHVVIQTEGRTVPDRTLEEAAVIAAFHSKAKLSALVPVDYTLIRHVRKPAGAKPGFVLYVQYKTAIVTPSREQVEALLEKPGRSAHV